jgi:outer membrane protein OmpA-like peptidoglycan-associated protein
MKYLNKILFGVMMMMFMTSHAQDSNNPWAISFGVNAVDTSSGASDRDASFSDRFNTMFNVSESWNILPSVSYINVSKYVGDNFSFGVSGTINKISKYTEWKGPGHTDVEVTNPGNIMYYAIDGSVKYSFMNLIKSKVLEPSLNLGGGYVFYGDKSYGTLNPGVGLTVWFSEFVGLSLETKYKKSFGARGSVDFPSHTQHTLGITFKFGGKDTDSDGVYDKDDACPEVAGLKQFNGCPDTDGDGIIDGSDTCPDVFGLVALNGCPDTDGDGIADKDDACPQVAGLVSLKGCPDADEDGVTDAADNCPAVKGPKENAGCPWPDTDGDSVLDKDDKCPDVVGSVANNGCPEVTVQALEDVNVQLKSIYFYSGKFTFKTGDVPVKLDVIASILIKYPNAKFSIEGHTDSDGSEIFNQKLSENRANVVKDELIKRGVIASNIVAIGFGETAPIASNKTAAGKALNRRTEVKLQK